MERDGRHLDSFTSSMIQYLNEVLIDRNCVSSNFRKYSVKNEDDFQFSLMLKPAFDSNCDDYIFRNKINSFSLNEGEVGRLIEESEGWRLHLAEASVKESKLWLKLNRPQAFAAVVNSILSQKSSYGKNFDGQQMITLTSEEIDASHLTEYRLSLVRTVAENFLTMGGFLLNDGEGTRIHFTTKNRSKDDVIPEVEIVCGPVINADTKKKEMEMTAQDYRRLLLKDLQKMSENKHKEEKYEKKILDSLIDATIKLSLLQVKPGQAVRLNLRSECRGSRDTSSKGGIFLQYNSSRLATIRKRFLELVAGGIYPEISRTQDVCFELLKEPEEWSLLFNFLLEFPALVDDVSGELIRGKANLHKICHFLSGLSSLFSLYYRRIRILLEPRTHLFPLIQARVLLAMSVEQVLDNGLALLNIKKVEQM